MCIVIENLPLGHLHTHVDTDVLVKLWLLNVFSEGSVEVAGAVSKGHAHWVLARLFKEVGILEACDIVSVKAEAFKAIIVGIHYWVLIFKDNQLNALEFVL